MSELRLYTFVNFYLSSIQQGIQSAHIAHELFVKYKNNKNQIEKIYEWATDHKTMIVLNGGPNQSIIEINNLFNDIVSDLLFITPFTSFYEDDPSLGGIMTSVGIILPEEIFAAINAEEVLSLCGYNDLNTNDRKDSFYYVNEDKIITHNYQKDSREWKIIKLIKSCRFAI